MSILLAVLLILWLSSAAYYLISAYCLASFHKSAKIEFFSENTPPVSVLKPLKGAGPDLYENLKSFVEQDYARYQVIFGVSDRSDPAYEAAERLISEYPGKEMLLVETGPPLCPNRKVSNLASMYASARHDIILVADSDMRVGRGYLCAVAEDFNEPSVGLVTCPYRGCMPRSVGAAFEALTINSDFFPSVTVAEKLEGISFALGATMAARREALDRIGGFGALGNFLADDYQFGNRVHKAGYKLKLSRYVVDSMQGDEGFREYFIHQLRWGRTYRACRPMSYFLSGLTKGTAIAVIFLIASGFSPAGWAVLGADLGLRNSLAIWLEKRFVKAPGTLRYYWLLPLKDLASALVWALSFMGGTVRWNDENFKIDGEGRMVKRA